jgi:VWFA-related protein
MKSGRQMLVVVVFLVLAAGTVGRLVCPRSRVHAQQQDAQAASGGTPVIRAESRLVLVDTVVTDKKGAYIHDLTAKDFKVWEDNKEQTIKGFSVESDNGSQANSQKRYLVLFFDNSTMDTGDQMRARQAATKFIDANAGPNRLMAIVDFGGVVHVSQNFTADTDRLKKVVAMVKGSSVSPNGPPVEIASLGPPILGNSEAEFGARSAFLALRTLAKGLASIQGRKTLVMLTSGFPVTPELQSELTAVIDACNKANVAVYPIDVRGLAASLNRPRQYQDARAASKPKLLAATYKYGGREGNGDPEPRLVFVQHGGGGGGGGGKPGGGGGGGAPGGGGGGKPGGGGGGTGGSGGGRSGGGGGGGARGGGGGTSPGQFLGTNPFNQPRTIVPQFSQSVSTNQQLLYALAEGTGGFVIVNSNDLLGGMEKIAKEQNEYYVLSYTPAESAEGTCHTLRVKVDRGGTVVRARSGYCNARPVDLLAGKPTEKELESRANGSQAGNLKASMQAPFFYTSPNTARVNLAMEIPADFLKFEKEKGKQHAEINVLGIAYKADGSVGARFSDTVNLDFDGKKEAEQFTRQSFHYENQFDIGPGQYNLKVVFSSSGQSFGKIEAPLAIDPYDGKKFTVSALALSKEMHRVSDLATGLDAQLLEDRTPLVTMGMQIVPTGSYHFKTSDMAAIYVEVYEPLLLAANPPKIGLELKVVDRKTGESKLDAGFSNTGPSMQPGNPMIPLGVRLPVDKLSPGSYRAELKAMDSAGNATQARTADFEVE